MLVSLLVVNDVTSYAIGFVPCRLRSLSAARMGFANGVLHVKLKTPSFMTTLGVGFAGIGIATAMLGGFTVRISDQSFRFLSLGRVLGLPMAAWIALWRRSLVFLSPRTNPSRPLALCDRHRRNDRPPCRNSDRADPHPGLCLGRAFYGLAGVLSVAQFGQGHALISQGRLFTTVTAVVVGGTALSGGVGSVLNSVIGVLIVVVLANGMVLMGVPPYVQQGVQGLLIIVAVALALDRSRLDVVK